VTARTRTEPRTGTIVINNYRILIADRGPQRTLLYTINQQEPVAQLLNGVGKPARFKKD